MRGIQFLTVRHCGDENSKPILHSPAVKRLKYMSLIRYCDSNHVLQRNFPPAWRCDCCGTAFARGVPSWSCRGSGCATAIDCCDSCMNTKGCAGRHFLRKLAVPVAWQCSGECNRTFRAQSVAFACPTCRLHYCNDCHGVPVSNSNSLEPLRAALVPP